MKELDEKSFFLGYDLATERESLFGRLAQVVMTTCNDHVASLLAEAYGFCRTLHQEIIARFCSGENITPWAIFRVGDSPDKVTLELRVKWGPDRLTQKPISFEPQPPHDSKRPYDLLDHYVTMARVTPSLFNPDLVYPLHFNP